MTTPVISVIVPTRANAARAPLLHRALDSIINQDRVRAQPIVVVNGSGQDAGLVAELRAIPDLIVVARLEPGLRNALDAGLGEVTAPFVSSLDDDDLLLPGALALRSDALAADSALDVVVTNGFSREGGQDTLNIENAAEVSRDPLRMLFERNWLLPGSWLARTSSVSPWLYHHMPDYLECTYLALRFAHDLRMRFLAEPTVVRCVDSPDSVSNSLVFKQGQPGALKSLTELSLPPGIIALLQHRFRMAWHDLANASLDAGELADAFRYHIRTLGSRGGWRHLPFARHLLRAALRGGNR